MKTRTVFPGLLLAPALALAAFVPAVLAQEPGAAEGERYRLERSAQGYVRMDTATGAISLCREEAGRLACAPAAEADTEGEVAAPDATATRLMARIEVLERRIAALEAGGAAPGLPSEKDFEQTLSYMERFFQRFMGIVRDFDRQPGGADKTPGETGGI